MAGHSKWANIQHRKGRQDEKRGKAWTRVIREIMVAARLGGEEFVLLLPATPANGAREVAERIRRAIAGGRIRTRDAESPIGQVTVSCGVAQVLPDESVDDAMLRADRALYGAKQSGRNRTMFAG